MLVPLLVLAGCGDDDDDEVGNGGDAVTPTVRTESAAGTVTPEIDTEDASVVVPTGSLGGVTIEELDAVQPGDDVVVEAQSDPNVTCSITFTDPAGNVADDAELGNPATDTEGRVRWEWTLDENTPTGTGEIRVTCSTGTATSEIEISE